MLRRPHSLPRRSSRGRRPKQQRPALEVEDLLHIDRVPPPWSSPLGDKEEEMVVASPETRAVAGDVPYPLPQEDHSVLLPSATSPTCSCPLKVYH
jgi:hypothetical protein